MPDILERIKTRVRGRSRSREAKGARNPRPSEDEVPKTPTIPTQFQNLSRPSLENSAFHVTTARGVRKSGDDDPFQQRVAETNTSPTSQRQKDVDLTKREQKANETNNSPTGLRNRDVDLTNKDDRAGEAIPNRTSSRIVISNRPQSQPSGQKSTNVNGPALAENKVERYATGDALAQKRIRDGGAEKSHAQLDGVEPSSINNNERVPTTLRESTFSSPTTTNAQNTSSVKDNIEPQSLAALTHNRRPSGSDSVRRKPLPSSLDGKLPTTRKPVPTPQNSTPQLNNSYTDRIESQKAKEAVIAGGHLRLPSHFNMNDTEETHVYEHHRPAVTHETIVKEKTEIFQEAITRDIHYHHYYTYLQPIKVVEVLPPKHFFLNLETGEKTEIPAPAGWSLPLSMGPISPDYDIVKGWTRHYLVDEEHPTGILEAPPLKHEGDVNNLRKAAQEQAV